VDLHLDRLRQEVRSRSSVILLAEPGAGKSTRVPPALEGKWIVLQPRRWATKLVATRIAEEQGWKLGQEVGYQIRFESLVSAQTRYTFMTEGVLLRKLVQDPELRGYQGVILDEFHERSLDADLSLAMLKEIQSSLREDLKIIVMSATLDPQPLLDFLPNSVLMEVEGRTFPVAKHYLGEKTPSQAIRHVLQEVEEGDILYFLPGAYEIERGVREIENELRALDESKNFEVLPLYSALRDSDQKKVFSPARPGIRRIILSTNIAETSITLPGIRAVIDSGWSKVMRTDPQFGQDRLETIRISLASSEQRAGRAGRVGPGFCFRLWTEGEHTQLRRFETPEVHRVNLSSALLTLAEYGAYPFDRFDWFEKPKPSMLEFSEGELKRVGFLDPRGQLTERGKLGGRLPLSPVLANLFLVSVDLGAPEFGARLCAWLEKGQLGSSPIESLESLQQALSRLDNQSQRGVEQLLRGHSSRGPSPTCVDPREVLLQGLSSRVFVDGNLVGRRRVVPLRDRLLPRVGIMLRSKEKTDRGVTQIQVSDFMPLEMSDLLPRAVKKSQVRFDAESERVRAESGIFFEDLALGPVTEVATRTEDAFKILVERVMQNPIVVFKRNPKFEEWWRRVEFFMRYHGELEIPWNEIVEAAAHGKTRLSEVAEFSVRSYLESIFDRSWVAKLEEWAPERIDVPSGSQLKIEYEHDPPKLSVRLQECFGWAETPRIAGGKVSLLMELLSPGFKPMQITRDLKSFWNGAYFEIKKELKAQYPKHAWPDDPWTAKAVAKGRHRC
jgi:ATP-dependent helicase HrpB